MIRKIRSFFKLAFGGHWGSIFSKIPPAKFLITSTNLFAKKLSYRYILLGGHGMGMQSFRYYLEQIGATPREIYWYEMLAPFVLYKKDEGLLIDKDPKNEFAKKILSKQKISIPVYQIIRDPISIIKSCLNATIFHRISVLQDKKDVENVLIEILKNTPHLMFYFTSLQNSIKHLATDITYLTQDSINQKNLQNTLNDFANRLNYSPMKIEESVLKGTAFPRAFPYIFEVEGKSFILSLNGREDKHSELDMGTFISKKFPIIKEKIFFIKEVIFEGYEDYPLYLASLTEKPSNNTITVRGGGYLFNRRKDSSLQNTCSSFFRKTSKSLFERKRDYRNFTF
ncbi:hypothetical protein [Helicobacter anatolicus]|uniref:hypothetical protein n=1 Tax=Helicobacter anatolicus TaxID=2905874 RepID=UPI001E42FC01|nr:hypothetical protein [Helicobacter anatolicus]MCE3038677.1 hypothetical protein [Helicobacter anatolicus]